jgi:hypothetical protein
MRLRHGQLGSTVLFKIATPPLPLDRQQALAVEEETASFSALISTWQLFPSSKYENSIIL